MIGDGSGSKKISPRPIIAAIICVLAFLGWMAIVDVRLLGLLKNTFLLSAASAAIAVPLGTILGIVIFRCNLRFARFWQAIVLLSMFMPLYIYAASWNATFGQFGIIPMNPWLAGWTGGILVHAIAAIPWVTMITGIASLNADPTLEEQALLYGGPRAAIQRVTVPFIAPSIAASFLWVLVVVSGEMTVSDIYRIRTYAEEVFINYQLDNFTIAPVFQPWTDRGEDISIGLWQQVMFVGLMIVFAVTMINQLLPIVHKPTSRKAVQFALGKMQLPVMGFVALLVFLVMGLPLMSLLFKSGAAFDGTEVRWTFASFFQNIVDLKDEIGTFGWSYVLAGLTVLFAVPPAILLGWLARRPGFFNTLPALIVASIGFALPGPTIALFLIVMLDQPDMFYSDLTIWLYDRTFFAPALAVAIRVVPICILICWAGCRQISEKLIEQSSLLGKGPLKRFCWFGVVANWKAIVASILIASVYGFGDLTASNLLIPPGQGVDTIPRSVFGSIHAGVDNKVAITCLAVILLNVKWVVALNFLLGKKYG